MTIADRLAAATVALARAGVETPRVDAEWLLADVLATGRLALHFRAAEPLSGEAEARYTAAVARRARREPIQRIVGFHDFRGVRVRLTADVLVPRAETETLVEVVLDLLHDTPAPRVVDLGAGSGCIAAALAQERSDAHVTAIDLSTAAARVARDNAPGARVVVGDLLEAVREASIDLVVSNPPYLPSGLLATLAPEVLGHEPRLALDGGADGLQVVRRLVPEARRVLRGGGALALETNGGAQAAATAARLREAGFDDVRVLRDLTGVNRFVTGRA